MTTHALLKRGGVALGSIGAAAILYRRLLRRPIINWGASDAEALRSGLSPSVPRERRGAVTVGLNTCSFAGERLFALPRGCAEKWRLAVRFCPPGFKPEPTLGF